MRYTEDEIKKATRSCRTRGCIGARALIPQMVPQYAKKSDHILDYGAGKEAIHARSLRTRGYHVTAHDFGENFKKGVHDPTALKHRYDLVYASNVLNVQSNQRMLERTLDEILHVLKAGGIFLCNYPTSPRYVEVDGEILSTYGLEVLLKERFKSIERVKASSPVWVCRK